MAIKKVKIESVSKNILRSAFVFEKSWDVVDAIEDMLEKLRSLDFFDYGLKDLMSWDGYCPEVKIDKWVDDVYNMKSENYSIDVFLGKNKIILVINSYVDRQNEISEAVFEFADFKDDLNKLKKERK